MYETQSTIAAWADAAFGDVELPQSSVARALKEMAELVACIADDDGDPDAEAADVAICLTRLARQADVELQLAGLDPLPLPAEPLVVVARIAEQLVRLLVTEPTSVQFGRRLQFIVQMLGALVASRGSSLGEAIDAKMAINRRRQWRRDGHGHGYHLSTAESLALGTWEDVRVRAEGGRP